MIWLIFTICLFVGLSSFMIAEAEHDGTTRQFVFGIIFVINIFVLIVFLVHASKSSFGYSSKDEIKKLEHDMYIIKKTKKSLTEEEYWGIHIEKRNEINKMRAERSKKISNFNYWFVLPRNW